MTEKVDQYESFSFPRDDWKLLLEFLDYGLYGGFASAEIQSDKNRKVVKAMHKIMKRRLEKLKKGSQT